MHIGITCTSDTDNSVKDLSMRIYFKRSGATISNIVVPITENINRTATNLFPNIEQTFAIPVRIRAHEAVTGWALFQISNEILSDSHIENYQVVASDTFNIESLFEIKVMREME